MPHVATQWQPKEWEPRNDNTSQARKMASGKVVIYPPKQQSNSSPRERKAGMRTVPSMGKLLSLDAQGFDSGLTHHAQNRSSDMLTPLSPIDTVFELESPRLPYSSNSSPNSSVVAELEDTSPPILPVPNVNCPRRTARASSSLQFQSSKTSVSCLSDDFYYIYTFHNTDGRPPQSKKTTNYTATPQRQMENSRYGDMV